MSNQKPSYEELEFRLLRAEAVIVALQNEQADEVIGAERPAMLEPKALQFELETHKIELEMQNEQLRESEQKLEESRNRYRDLYDFAPAGYLTLDENDTILEANLTGSKLLGIDRSKLIGRRLTQMLGADAKVAWFGHRDALLDEGGQQSCEVHINVSDKDNDRASPIRKRGTTDADPSLASPARVTETTPRVFEVQSELAQNNGTDARQLRCMLVDVTERHQAEEELRIRDRSFESSPTGLLITDATQPDNPIVYCNPAFERITGYLAEEVKGRNCRFLQSDDRDQPELSELRDAIRQGRSIQVVLRNYRKDGSMFWNELSIGPVHNATGQITHFVGIQNDVTRRVEAEERLKNYADELEVAVQQRTLELSQSEARYRNFVEHSSDGVVLCEFTEPIPIDLPEDEQVRRIHRGYTFATCNDAFSQMYGFDKAEDLIGQGKRDVDGQEENLNGKNLQTIEQFIRGGYRNRAALTEEFDRHGNRILIENNQVGIVRDGCLTHLWASQRDVTEKLAAEQTLLESEERFRLVFEQAGVGVAIIDTKTGTFERINECYAKILGGSVEQLVGKTFMQFTHADDVQADLDQMQRLIDGNIRNFSIEKRYVRSDDSQVWVNLTVSPMWQPGEEPTLHIAIVADITERKHAEEALEDSEERFRAVFEQAAVGVALKNDSGEIARINQKYADILGRSVEELIGSSYIDFTHPDDVQLEQQKLQQLQNKEVAEFSLEKRCLHSDGSLVWVDLAISRLESAGQALHVAIVQNVSDRKLAERDLRDREEQFRAIVENSHELISMYDEKQLLYLNRPGYEMLGLDPALDLANQPIAAAMIPPQDRSEIVAEAIRALDHGKKVFNQTFTRVDGKTIHVEGIGTTIELQGRPVQVNILQDVTRRKQAEEQLARHRDELAHMGRVHLAGEMATGIAHELNQPLVAISLQSQICAKLVEQLPQTQSLADLNTPLQQIADQALRAGRVVNFLRGFVRKEEGHRSSHDINDIVHAAIDHSERSFNDPTVNIRFDPLPELPKIIVDRIQIEQVLINLIQNAFEAMQTNDCDDRRLSIGAVPMEGFLEVFVKDNGSGIDANNLDQVFESFYTTKQHGLGLGLSICQTIIEAHGGRLWCTRNADRGATFHITIPLSNGVAPD